MKKNLKKRLAMVLAAAMVFSTPVAVNKTVVNAEGTATTIPQPVKTILEGTMVDLSNAISEPVDTYDNPLKGKELEGATISFEYEPTKEADVRELGTILAMHNVNSETGNIDGRMYLTPSSYFGYNADGGIMDLNMNEYASVNKHFKTSGKQEITMTFAKDGFVLYVDGVEAYNETTGILGGTNTMTDYNNVLTFLSTSANKVLLGTGSFWSAAGFDEANGKVGNIKFYDTALDASQVNKLVEKIAVVVTGPSISATVGESSIQYSFDALNVPTGTKFEVSVTKDSNDNSTVTGSAVAAADGRFTYSYPEGNKGTLESGTYTFKVTDIEAAENDNTNYVLDGDAVESVKVTVVDGVITGSEEVETVTVNVTEGKTALTTDKKSIDYTFKASNAPSGGSFVVSVFKDDATVATVTGSAAAADLEYTYTPEANGKYTFKVTGIKAAENDTKVYTLSGDAAAELDFTVPTTTPPTTQPTTQPTTKPSTPPTTKPSTPPTSNPPATSQATVNKVTVKAANQKAGTKTVYLKKGGKVTLTATVTGTGSFSKSVTWTSSKKTVATVSAKGVVTAKKAGTAKITATSKTNKAKKATITIKVSKKAKKNKKLTLKVKKKSLKKGKTYTVAIKAMTKGTTDAVTYKTSKKAVAAVDKFGVVTAKKKGTANITVKCGKKSAKLKITVK